MFFPYSDDDSKLRGTPFVTFTLIIINILVFVFFQGVGTNDKFTYAWSTVPAEIITGRDIVKPAEQFIDKATGITHKMPPLYETPTNVYLTMLTSTFMHGSIAHIFGNMLYLWIFGDNIENHLGHIKFLIFYLATGIIASLCHVLSSYFQAQNTLVPSLGASGAISAVMGAYMCLFPGNRIKALVLYFPTQVPAIVALGVWIGFQIWNGLGSLGAKGGGVAYAAHIGGFIAGFVLIRFISDSVKQNQKY